MQQEEIKFWRIFFFRVLIFSAIVAAIIFTTTELSKEFMMKALQLSEQEFRRDVMSSMVILRVLLLFILLPITLVFHSLLKKTK